MSVIFPDDINDQRKDDLTKRVDTLYDYIAYMKEQLEFWARNRTREINEGAVNGYRITGDLDVDSITAQELAAPQALHLVTTITAGSTETITIPDSYRGIICAFRGASTMGLYMVNSSSTGTVSVCKVSPVSTLTLTAGTRQLTIANSSTGGAYIYAIGNKA